MKLTKLLPIVGIGATAAAITPFAVSCNNGEVEPPLPEAKQDITAYYDDGEMTTRDPSTGWTTITKNVAVNAIFDLSKWGQEDAALPSKFELEIGFDKVSSKLTHKKIEKKGGGEIKATWKTSKWNGTYSEICVIDVAKAGLTASDSITLIHGFMKNPEKMKDGIEIRHALRLYE